MHKSWTVILLLVMGVALSGCAHIPGETDLNDVARATNLSNVTTGDGTFENYTATGYYTGTEFGITVGLPGLVKLFEIFPARSNEDLLSDVARMATTDGADAMINVTPHQECYFGLPFFIIGLYVDRAEGTGIRIK